MGKERGHHAGVDPAGAYSAGEHLLGVILLVVWSVYHNFNVTMQHVCTQAPIAALPLNGPDVVTQPSWCLAGATAPQRFILLADWGLSQNSSVTLQHALQSAANTSAPAVLYIADFCYAGERLLIHWSLMLLLMSTCCCSCWHSCCQHQHRPSCTQHCQLLLGW